MFEAIKWYVHITFQRTKLNAIQPHPYPQHFVYIILDQKYKISINEWYNNLADSAGVLAHEVGHALGMQHDFGSGGTSDVRYDSQGNRCTGINGLMDYGARSSVDKFSSCSKEDFRTWYNQVVQTYGSFCLACSKFD